MFIDHQQEQWPDWLATAEFTYNNKVQTSTKVLPFKANNGQDLCMGFKIRKKEKFEKAEEFVTRMKEIHEEAEYKGDWGARLQENPQIYYSLQL